MEQTEKTIVNTDSGLKNGLNRCPSCGSTDIGLDIKTGQLQCNKCRNLFAANLVVQDDIEHLKGEKVGGGAKDIIPDAEQILSFKCSSCGGTVVVNTEESTLARCHWCRHSLSINEQIPNGAVPDMVLPFKLEKEASRKKIQEFVKQRQFFAHPTFKKEFSTENIMGVYLPYMVVDVNGDCKFVGQGEHLVRSYTVGVGKNKQTRYDADLYNVSREFELLVDDLTIESSGEKLNQNTKINTNNVINAIMPFDTENCVSWNANFLKGFASEKRDINTENLKPLLMRQAEDVARYQANTTLSFYGRGVRWDTEDLKINGLSWRSAYLPVWLYSYYQKDAKLLHYCAVNGRTGEIMGSVPIHKAKLFLVSLFVELIGIFVGTSILMNVEEDGAILGLLGYTVGFIFYFTIWSRYRNAGQRHFHEKETKAKMKDLKQTDDLVEHRTGLANSMMKGANNMRVDGNLNKGDDGMLAKAMEEIDVFKGL